MKKIVIILVLLVLFLTFTSCGKGESGTITITKSNFDKYFTVGIACGVIQNNKTCNVTLTITKKSNVKSVNQVNIVVNARLKGEYLTSPDKHIQNFSNESISFDVTCFSGDSRYTFDKTFTKKLLVECRPNGYSIVSVSGTIEV